MHHKVQAGLTFSPPRMIMSLARCQRVVVCSVRTAVTEEQVAVCVNKAQVARVEPALLADRLARRL